MIHWQFNCSEIHTIWYLLFLCFPLLLFCCNTLTCMTLHCLSIRYLAFFFFFFLYIYTTHTHWMIKMFACKISTVDICESVYASVYVCACVRVFYLCRLACVCVCVCMVDKIGYFNELFLLGWTAYTKTHNLWAGDVFSTVKP